MAVTADLETQVVPDWERLTAHIEADKESKDRLGWVREMYAFSIAVALAGTNYLRAQSPRLSNCKI